VAIEVDDGRRWRPYKPLPGLRSSDELRAIQGLDEESGLISRHGDCDAAPRAQRMTTPALGVSRYLSRAVMNWLAE